MPGNYPRHHTFLVHFNAQNASWKNALFVNENNREPYRDKPPNPSPYFPVNELHPLLHLLFSSKLAWIYLHALCYFYKTDNIHVRLALLSANRHIAHDCLLPPANHLSYDFPNHHLMAVEDYASYWSNLLI